MDVEKCWFCGGTLVKKKVDVIRKRHDKYYKIINVSADVCEECGERFFGPEATEKMNDVFSENNPPDDIEDLPVYKIAS